MLNLYRVNAAWRSVGRMRKMKPTVVWALFALLPTTIGLQAAILGPSLSKQLTGLSASANVGTVIVAFKQTTGLGPAQFAALTAAGVTSGTTLPHLGMVAFPATAGQVQTLAGNSA